VKEIEASLPKRPVNVLGCCLVEGDAASASRTRRQHRRALLASLALQFLLLAALVLWPLLVTGERMQAYTVVLRPPYYGSRHGNLQTHSGPPGRQTTLSKPAIIYQPPKIPNSVGPADRAAQNSAGSGVEMDPFGAGKETGFPLALETTSPQSIVPPRPPAAPPAEKKVRVKQSEGVQGALLVHRVEPVYPRIAIATRIEGTVRLRAIIARDGTVTSLELLSGHLILARAAMDGVGQWRYRPTLLNGEPVEVETYITVIFTLAR
jgi:protein TonB